MSDYRLKGTDVDLPRRAAERVLDIGTEDLAKNLRDSMVREAPRGRTGDLQKGIGAYPAGDLRWIIEGEAAHTEYVLKGTGEYGPRGQPYWVEPETARVLHWTEGGNDFFSMGHEVRGMEANEFHQRALAYERRRLETYYRNAAQHTLRAGA